MIKNLTFTLLLVIIGSCTYKGNLGQYITSPNKYNLKNRGIQHKEFYGKVIFKNSNKRTPELQELNQKLDNALKYKSEICFYHVEYNERMCYKSRSKYTHPKLENVDPSKIYYINGLLDAERKYNYFNVLGYTYPGTIKLESITVEYYTSYKKHFAGQFNESESFEEKFYFDNIFLTIGEEEENIYFGEITFDFQMLFATGLDLKRGFYINNLKDAKSKFLLINSERKDILPKKDIIFKKFNTENFSHNKEVKKNTRKAVYYR